MEYIIRNYTAREYPWDTTFYLNLIFEPLEETFKKWCELESNDYQFLTIIKKDSLSQYEKEMGNLTIENNTIDFSKLDLFTTQGYYTQNNILLRLKDPFNNIYRYCEVFEKNPIVNACLEKLDFLSKNPNECNNQCELISILKTLDQWWY